MTRKVSPGQQWRPPSAADQNAWSEAADDFQRRRRLGEPTPGDYRLRDFTSIKIQNTTGGAVVLGEALEIGSSPIGDPKNSHRWFTGTTPTDAEKPFCILLDPGKDDDFIDGIVTGVCVARVNVQSTSHKYAGINGGSRVLNSLSAGPTRILSALTATGAQDCLVRLGTDIPCVMNAKLNGALAAGTTSAPASASATLQEGSGGLTGTGQTITVYSWFATAFNSGTYITVFRDIFGTWWLLTADCPAS